MDASQAQIERFERAAESEAELTPRQRRVLDLIVKGKTNGEIGEALGITLDGAKWNVSEILSKLGLATREEAADYWRWRKRRVGAIGRGLSRALGALPLGKLAIGAGAVAGVVLAVSAFGSRSSDAQTGPGAFTMEYTTTTITEARRDPAGGNLMPWSVPDRTVQRATVIVGDKTHTYTELRTEIPFLDEGLYARWVADGTSVWYWEADFNEYMETVIAENETYSGYYGGFGEVGPLPHTTLDDLLLELRDGYDEVRVVREETMLGREVTVIEYGPTVEVTGGRGEVFDQETVLLWVDPETMFVLQRVQEMDSRTRITRVEGLEFDVDVDWGQFEFDPPEGSVVMPQTRVLDSESMFWIVRGQPIVAPPGMFSPAYLPAGMAVLAGGTGIPNGVRGGFDVLLTPAATADTSTYLRIHQRRRESGLPDELAQGTRVSLGAERAYWQPQGDVDHLAWERDGVSIHLEARGLSIEELVRVAKSMTVSDGVERPTEVPLPTMPASGP